MSEQDTTPDPLARLRAALESRGLDWLVAGVENLRAAHAAEVAAKDAEIDRLKEELGKVESAVRAFCPVEHSEDLDAAYVCMGESGDPIFEVDTREAAIAQAIGAWDATSRKLSDTHAEIARLKAQLGAGASETKDCPHAAPHRYCQKCVVSPCPIGLDKPTVVDEKHIDAASTRAIVVIFNQFNALKRLGWREAQHCPKDGSTFEVIEAGSTGIHRCHYSGDWPNGTYWIEDTNDLWPSRPILFRPLPSPPQAPQEEP